MAKYRKRPVVIEAVQYDGSPVDGVCTESKPHGCLAHMPHTHTLEGPLRVSPGDWIITGIKGERYPCKPDVFALTHPSDAASRARGL